MVQFCIVGKVKTTVHFLLVVVVHPVPLFLMMLFMLHRQMIQWLIFFNYPIRKSLVGTNIKVLSLKLLSSIMALKHIVWISLTIIAPNHPSFLVEGVSMVECKAIFVKVLEGVWGETSLKKFPPTKY